MVARKALVVGIDDYPNCPLHGCCNDSEVIKDLLANDGNGDPNFSTLKILETDQYDKWFKKLKDAIAKARVNPRVRRIELSGELGGLEWPLT